MIVVLMGYMGSGKSTLGKNLATVLDYDFLDLDDYITEKENASISSLFKTRGEVYFRQKESYYLNEIIEQKDNTILALGGGTPCYGNNINILLNNANVKLFYLKLSIPQLVERLFNERKNRPLISHLNSEEELLEFTGKHLFERTHYYNKADFIIDAGNQDKQDVLEKIVMHLI